MKFKKGDTAWVYDSSIGWVQVYIIRAFNNYYIVKRINASVAFGASEHRLISCEEYNKISKNNTFDYNNRPPELH